MKEISVWGVLGTVLLGVAMAELVGYGLHRMMHSGRFPRFSRAHMIHHLVLYAPGQAMREATYRDATVGRAALGNIGWEWLAPSGAILAVIWVALWALGVEWMYRVLGMVVLVGWPLLMFSYLHDGMHVTGFWMERAPLLGSWFVRARRLHDIHHRTLNDDGKMDRNFGIGFFVFDRIFGTMKKRHSALNCKGYREALRRHVELGAEEELKSFPSEYRCE